MNALAQLLAKSRAPKGTDPRIAAIHLRNWPKTKKGKRK